MASKHQNLTLLHLSDLHMRNDEEEKTDRSVVLDPLLERLEADYKNNLRPELVLITGDIAFKGIKAEYELALLFLKDLLSVLQLDEDRLYMVPGNHDVMRKEYRPRDIPIYETNRELNEELANPKHRADLLKGMRDYFEFIQTNFPHMDSKSGDLVPFVDCFKSETGLCLGLVGLNSAWMCRKRKNDESDSGQIAIGQHQIKSAFKELEERGEVQATVAMFHHPLSWLAHMDRRVCDKFLDRTIALAGHLHEPGGGYLHGFTTRMAHIQAGGAYLGSDSNWPSRCHYIGIDFDSRSLRLDFRAFSKSGSVWFVDAETGGDGGEAEIPVRFLGVDDNGSKSGAPSLACPEFPETYAKWLKDNYWYLDVKRLNPKGMQKPSCLPELYVPLYGIDPAKIILNPEFKELNARQEGTYFKAKQGEPIYSDIETLVAKYNSLLISGQAGSGKSTLLRHLAYTVSPKTEKAPASPELVGYLPILIYLKELVAYCQEDSIKLDRNYSVGEGILRWYLLDRLDGTLELDVVREFARCGRLLLLVDGLDETVEDTRDRVVKAMANELSANDGNKIVLAGRPHGLGGAPNDRFGMNKTSVIPLNPGQIEMFVRQWFDYHNQGTEGAGKKRADDLLADIAHHPGIDELAVNPLMLTAICFLYEDQKKLPDQRALLLRMFIDNIISRRFPRDHEEVLDHIKVLALDMHREKRVKVLDRDEAVFAMAKTLKPLPDEDAAQFNRRKRKLFEYIEPQCGLLVSKGGQTEFWHLLFQEFLTAQRLMNISEDNHAAIAGHWDDKWYKEVIELYVSYLSNDNARTANNIVKSILESKDEAPYWRWRLAARTLVDFHKSRRNDDVLELARTRLKQIIQKPLEAATLNDAGTSLGWLGDDRDLESFAQVEGGDYELDNIGKRSIEVFEIARFPVTNQFFSKFIKAKGYETQALWTKQGKKWLKERGATQPITWSERKYRCSNQPVTGVSWYEATAFCNWLTESNAEYNYFLPSEEQWQAAAAGKEKREYPWDDASPTGRCNIEKSGIGKPSPVGIFARGRTPGDKATAIYDLAGNVWEWTCTNHKTEKTADDFLYDEEWKKQREAGVPCLRGGSWCDPAEYARCADRGFSYDPGERDLPVGIRCSRTLK